VNIKIEDDDGGPVFPGSDFTMRDWFAGQALAGMAAGPYWCENIQPKSPQHIWDVAVSAYAMADAMLAARKESK
jgi:hypothetical protein